MRRTALITVLFACLAAPTAAPAATSWVITGAGFGHGIGMSQYGAYGYAQHGWDYRRILEHYYTGTQIGRAPQKTIRVLLRSGAGSLSVSHVSRAGSKALDPNAFYTARSKGDAVVLRNARGHRVASAAGPLLLRGPGGYTRLGGAYRGAMELRGGGGVTAINVVGLDQYVQGVIPGEMPPTWLPEALKVQAVAARSYAIATDAGSALFDQYADTRSQMYVGMSAEQPSTNSAASDTAGQVVLAGGAVATTYYFSTSGGRTENVENVFLGAAASPYLRSVKDRYDGGSPRHRWRVSMSGARMKAKLGAMCSGRFRAIKVVKRGVSPRVVAADVVCGGGTVRTTGPALRTRLGLYDSWFTVTRASSTAKGSTAAKGLVPLMGSLITPRKITGSFRPVPRAGVVDVQRLSSDGRWQLVARGLTNRAGACGVPVYGSGLYRVSAGGVSADPVAVR